MKRKRTLVRLAANPLPPSCRGASSGLRRAIFKNYLVHPAQILKLRIIRKKKIKESEI
jgi:hypothetical protein